MIRRGVEMFDVGHRRVYAGGCTPPLPLEGGAPAGGGTPGHFTQDPAMQILYIYIARCTYDSLEPLAS